MANLAGGKIGDAQKRGAFQMISDRLYLRILGIMLVVGPLSFSSAISQSAPRRVHAGTLACKVSAGIGMIVTSKKGLECTFKSIRFPPERYTGYIQKFGLDIGVTKAGAIVWNVFETGAQRNNLGGTYVGATAEATFAAGLGANVLIGGSQKAIALQPLSMTGQTGLNLAAGVGKITLRQSP
jgi:hypothetical protein